MDKKNFSVLLIMPECNPGWSSVPLEAYHYFNEISKRISVTLVTHERNKENLEKARINQKIIYISECILTQRYYRLVHFLTQKKNINWPLYHALTYPVYEEFNCKVYKKFRASLLNKDFDIVHSFTPILPRFPVKLIKACSHTPFILGPVNGGIPFPEGFKKIARNEFAHLNFLRTFSCFLPDYITTYKKADKILAGSRYTLGMLKRMFNITGNRIELFSENGVEKDLFLEPRGNLHKQEGIQLLFVGRLVPYKGLDMLIEAVAKLKGSSKEQISLTIVGDGQEKARLVEIVQALGVAHLVNFTGWVEQRGTLEYYKKADIFCFPSIREFGGAVVLEAMAAGLPCIVINYGGIGEYVTEATGFKIDPLSREYVIDELRHKIQILIDSPKLRQEMSREAVVRAREFEWGNKAEKIINIYEKVLRDKK